MKLDEIRSIAMSRGISPGRASKGELIKLIQSDEGNFDCFATAYHGECNQADCAWRADCLATSEYGELS